MEFFAETVDGLLVHVGLGDEFGERHWGRVNCHSALRWEMVRIL